MAKEAVQPTPIPTGDPKADTINTKDFCASIIDTKHTYYYQDEIIKRATESLTKK